MPPKKQTPSSSSGKIKEDKVRTWNKKTTTYVWFALDIWNEECQWVFIIMIWCVFCSVQKQNGRLKLEFPFGLKEK